MYERLVRISNRVIVAAYATIFALLAIWLPRDLDAALLTALYGGCFLILSASFPAIREAVRKQLYSRYILRRYSSILIEFIGKLQASFSYNDLIGYVQGILEEKLDCAVLFINMKAGSTIYASPQRITASNETHATINRNFSSWQNGFFYFDDDLGLLSSNRNARGFFLNYNDIHMYVFCRFLGDLEPMLFTELNKEYSTYLDRVETIQRMFSISALSTEWEMVAKTQKAFLPKSMPELKGVEAAFYFRPLVNVSGDYYDVIPLSETKTLIALGDVSGKGLAAALVMGIIVNTIKTSANKEDLAQVVLNIDEAVKAMKFGDKYTVMFIGIIDTAERSLRYVNASMPETMIITQAPEGPRVKPLASNNSVIGIIDIESIIVDEVRLYPNDVILVTSDGVTEVADAHNKLLGDTELYFTTIREASKKKPQAVVDAISNLVIRFAGSRPLRDDVTMIVAKIGGDV